MKQLFTIPALVLGGALLLAGCGGGGDTGPTAAETEAMKQAEADAAAREAATKAITAANVAALALSVSSNQAAVDEVGDLIETATTAIEGLPEGERDAATAMLATASRLAAATQAVINARDDANVSEREKQDAEDALNDKLAEEELKATIAAAKKVKAAIEAVAELSAANRPVVNSATMIPIIDVNDDGTADDTDAIALMKGAAVGSIGSWSGTDYQGEAGVGTGKTTGMVRAYSNQKAPARVPFAGATNAAGAPLEADAVRGGFTLTTEANPKIAGPSFPTHLTQETYIGNDRSFSGTYEGASGNYRCESTAACTAQRTADGIILSAGWTFTPVSNAMRSVADPSYLQFGWWARHDKDGLTHVGAFRGETGLTAVTAIAATDTGSATYVGKAAGQFAVSGSLDPAEDNSGHFTADAELKATFATTSSTLHGTIDEFRLNGGSDDPGWSVALEQATIDGTDGSFSDTDNGTAWSIGTTTGDAAGEWEARMFNDVTSDTIPDSVLGSFRSEFRETHSMVGGFGAELQE